MTGSSQPLKKAIAGGAIHHTGFLEFVWEFEAHVIMLASTGIVCEEDSRAILTALEQLKKKYESGEYVLDKQKEDVHMNVEEYVIQQVGNRGKRMHTARSRNDQVVTDTKIHVRSLVIDIHEELISFQKELLRFASQHVDTVTVGYTHTQHAQPITLGFWATAYVGMIFRDMDRLTHSYKVINTNPLGACALSGTSFPIDREITTKLLGFSSIQEHSLDAVSSRDFAVQVLSTLAILMSNVSKMAEEIIYWSTFEFGTIEVDDSYAHGSSIMPQKKNPGMAELIRGRTGKIYGLLIQLLTTLKAIPTGYNRDLQEDKPPLWEAAKLIISTVITLKGIIRTMKVNKKRMLQLSQSNFSTATELADYLVKTQNLPFRECHRIVGELIAGLIDRGHTFKDIPKVQRTLSQLGVNIKEDDLYKVLDSREAVENHTSVGGTSPGEVKRMIRKYEIELEEQERDLLNRKMAIENAFNKTAEIVASVLKGKPVKDYISYLD